MCHDTSMTIQFRKTCAADEMLLLGWLDEPHVRAFWDNSDEHRANLLGYLSGNKDLYDYWVGTLEQDSSPFCLFLTSDAGFDTPDFFLDHLTLQGETWTIDYMIGSPEHVGRGFGSQSLDAFCRFLKTIHPTVSSFIIDPATQNTRAVHVYGRAGFVKVGTYTPAEGSFQGMPHEIMKRDMS